VRAIASPDSGDYPIVGVSSRRRTWKSAARFTAYAGFVWFDPVFNSEIGHALEFLGVVRDQGEALKESVGGEKEVVVSDRGSGSLKVGPDVPIYRGSAGREVDDIKRTEELGQRKLVLLLLDAVGNAELQFTECDCRNPDISDAEAREPLVHVFRRTLDDIDTGIGVQQVSHQSKLSRSGCDP